MGRGWQPDPKAMKPSSRQESVESFPSSLLIVKPNGGIMTKFETIKKQFAVIEINGGDYYYIPALTCFLRYTGDARFVEVTDVDLLVELKAAIKD